MSLSSRPMRPILLAAALAVASSAGAQSPLAPNAQWYSDYLRQSRSVAIGDGRTLNLHCQGAGAPTVILEAGLSESAYTWWRVQPAIARFTRVCAYDRAGYGRSPMGPLPRDTRAEVADLEVLLRAAGVKAPYVLVGHSMGGYNVRLFASRHRESTAGLVLVDSSAVDQLPLMEAALPTIGGGAKRAVAGARACADPARDARTAEACTAIAPEGFPADLAQPFVAASGLAASRTRLSEIEAFIGLNSAQVAAEARPLGDLPLVVLTRGERSTNMSPEDAATEWRVWHGLHEDLAKLSTLSRHRIVEGAGHYIQLDRPEAVVQAVADVVACARTTAACPLKAAK